jgi:peptide-methionine (S)-S-oxide reductase
MADSDLENQTHTAMKKYVIVSLSFVLLSLQASCQSNTKNKQAESTAQKEQTPLQVKSEDGYERAYFASGCFWCVEAVYESVKGVKESISGYSGGHTNNPTYEDSNTGRTGHAEAVEIIYDSKVVSFNDLVDVYFGSQNITQVNGQGPDHGSQYRSIIFYQNAEQKEIIDAKIADLEKELGEGKVAAQVLPFQKFWVAEGYHQDFERLNPDHGYIRNVSVPRLKRFQKKFPQLLKEGAEH